MPWRAWTVLLSVFPHVAGMTGVPLGLAIDWNRVLQTLYPSWPPVVILMISTTWVTRIRRFSHYAWPMTEILYERCVRYYLRSIYYNYIWSEWYNVWCTVYKNIYGNITEYDNILEFYSPPLFILIMFFN
jgi:hypothetical protein